MVFTSPALLLLLAMSVFPLLWTLYLSFTDYSATRGGPAEFVGFGNYTAILTSPQVHQRTLTTLIFVVGAVILQTVLGFTIAYLISRRTRGRGLLTTLFLVPMMLSPVVVGLFWRFMLDAQFGVVNSMLGSLGLGQVEWLTRQRTALLSLIVVDTWQWTPFIMLIALAGLTAVPKYLYEAASIDRASEWFRFRTITLPLVWPLLLIAVLFRAIEAFRQFDLVYILTSGGPGVSTETLSFHVYKVAFLGFNTGTASAYGILMVIVVIILTQFYLRYLNKLKED
ncbi:carbohydrate ABC transporter permease [Dactylosporangium aurantiacum]|uniref:carbohydrate ABC transporter permease n=1 Tax=Dactylosporangium aurantiacum TaxID=35754 RepID=UPI000AD629F6|nr:sugar ABC transporter permease [Dactylosporangium aurantiacum]MDG6106167.1 sugar ABC transporter permease [Dactylosporangium aurantiacum]